MPTIVVKWDFEDGTPQGWALGSYTSLDNTGALQGTYSLKFARSVSAGSSATSYTDTIASISNIDLSTVSKPILLLATRIDASMSGYSQGGYIIFGIRVTVKDSTTTYVDTVEQLYYHATSLNISNVVRIPIFDLSATSRKSNLQIVIATSITIYNCAFNISIYLDNIVILDGGDYEYNTGIVASDGEDKTITVSIPSTDGDLSTVTVARVGISLMTPDWNYKNIAFTATHNQGSLAIDSSYASTSPGNTHTNYQAPSTAPTVFQSISIRVYQWNIGAYAGWLEKVAVAFLDASWNLVRLYVFNIYFTANGVSPRFINAVTTTTYGTLVSGNRTFSVRIYGNAFDVALRVRYIYGDRTVVVSGIVKLEIFSSDLVTKYGEVSIDITLANDQTTAYITGLPTNTDLVIRMSWTIQANSRIVLLAYPLFRVY